MGRSVLVTGAAGGIGAACVAWFKARGDKVREFRRDQHGDACDEDALSARLVRMPSLDVVVHAVGTTGDGGLQDHSIDAWRRVLDDNLTSAFVVAKATRPMMRRGSSVVFFSSVNGRHGGNNLSGPAYAASKAAIIGLTRYLAKDYAADGVRVNAIAPGPVATPMLHRLPDVEREQLRHAMPLGEVTDPSEIAGTVGWLCSPDSASITGAVIDVNGGTWMG